MRLGNMLKIEDNTDDMTNMLTAQMSRRVTKDDDLNDWFDEMRKFYEHIHTSTYWEIREQTTESIGWDPT